MKIPIGIVQQELDSRSPFTVLLAMTLLFRTTPETSLTQFIAASCCRADVAGLTLRHGVGIEILQLAAKHRLALHGPRQLVRRENLEVVK